MRANFVTMTSLFAKYADYLMLGGNGKLFPNVIEANVWALENKFNGVLYAVERDWDDYLHFSLGEYKNGIFCDYYEIRNERLPPIINRRSVHLKRRCKDKMYYHWHRHDEKRRERRQNKTFIIEGLSDMAD